MFMVIHFWTTSAAQEQSYHAPRGRAMGAFIFAKAPLRSCSICEDWKPMLTHTGRGRTTGQHEPPAWRSDPASITFSIGTIDVYPLILSLGAFAP
jgi:hypothetical protein